MKKDSTVDDLHPDTPRRPKGAAWRDDRAAASERAEEQRTAADQAKRQRRDLADATRSHERGARSSQVRLGRERASDDASLDAERHQAERARAREQRLAERAVDEESHLRQAAEDRAKALLDRLSAQLVDEVDVRRRALVEMRSIAQATRDLLVMADARRSIEPSIRELTAATERLRQVLDEALPRT